MHNNLDRSERLSRSDIRVGDITLLINQYMAVVDGRKIALTLVEYRLLLTLTRNPGQTLSMDQLAQLDSNHSDPPSNRALRARVATIRRKIGRAASQIENVRGIGYRIIEK